MEKLLIATNNRHKLAEIRAILGERFLTVLSLEEIGLELDVVEDGDTFDENALKKARAAMRASGLPALADDSGLEVGALGGAPGVYSARYAGEPCDDAANNAKLLEALSGVEGARRGARFVASIALIHPQKGTIAVRGEVEGVILDEARGENGFGYDPLFFVPEYGVTTAQMETALKNSISHRARALQALAQALDRGAWG